VGYTFVNTFDYRNSAGAKIESDPYSSIQIMPELKVIGNTKSGWQPYASVGMVYNIGVGNRTITANDVKLPQLSNRAYVQYGVGVQRSWADRFTAFFETLFRGGGRNGVMLFGGFRWTFGGGSDKSANGKQAQKTVIKQIKK
ncbi:autotransporter outer membrane beta-barrel domain-containing protein, partial [bacterium]|nr:autotransporter outer membrane beta-barrel domain-containing protein [bacterium]